MALSGVPAGLKLEGERSTESLITRSEAKAAATAAIIGTTSLGAMPTGAEASPAPMRQVVEEVILPSGPELVPDSVTVNHIVETGETLGGIGRTYGVNLSVLAQKFENPDLINPGQVISIPVEKRL